MLKAPKQDFTSKSVSSRPGKERQRKRRKVTCRWCGEHGQSKCTCIDFGDVPLTAAVEKRPKVGVQLRISKICVKNQPRRILYPNQLENYSEIQPSRLLQPNQLKSHSKNQVVDWLCLNASQKAVSEAAYARNFPKYVRKNIRTKTRCFLAGLITISLSQPRWI